MPTSNCERFDATGWSTQGTPGSGGAPNAVTAEQVAYGPNSAALIAAGVDNVDAALEAIASGATFAEALAAQGINPSSLVSTDAAGNLVGTVLAPSSLFTTDAAGAITPVTLDPGSVITTDAAGNIVSLDMPASSVLAADANGDLAPVALPPNSVLVADGTGAMVPVTSTIADGIPGQLVKDPITNEMMFKPIGATQTVRTVTTSDLLDTVNSITPVALTIDSTLTDHFPGSLANVGTDLVFTAPVAGYYRATGNFVADATVQVASVSTGLIAFVVDALGPDGTRYRLHEPTNSFTPGLAVGATKFFGGAGASPAVYLAAGQALNINAVAFNPHDGAALFKSVVGQTFSVTLVA